MQTWSEKIKLRETLWYVSRLIISALHLLKKIMIKDIIIKYKIHTNISFILAVNSIIKNLNNQVALLVCAKFQYVLPWRIKIAKIFE